MNARIFKATLTAPALTAFLLFAVPLLGQPHGSEEAVEESLFLDFLSKLRPHEDTEVPFPAEPVDLEHFGLEADELDREHVLGLDPIESPEHSFATTPGPPASPVFDREPEDVLRPRPQRETFPFEAFEYEEGTPTVYCMPARICSVELAPGEAILGRAMGDPARWLYQELAAGTGDESRVLVAFMPKAFGARTNLVLTTDRRVYTLDLVSADVDENDDAPRPHLTERARFAYPESWTEVRERAPIDITTEAEQGEDVADVSPNLSFHYATVEPRRRSRRFGWRPIVYDDGTFTFVRLPSSLATLPAIRGIDHAGVPFQLNETYRRSPTGTFIEIPRLINRIELASGTGRDRRIVTVYRNVRVHE